MSVDDSSDSWSSVYGAVALVFEPSMTGELVEEASAFMSLNSSLMASSSVAGVSVDDSSVTGILGAVVSIPWELVTDASVVVLPSVTISVATSLVTVLSSVVWSISHPLYLH